MAPIFSSLSGISTTRQFIFGRSKKPDLYTWTIGTSYTFQQSSNSRSGNISSSATSFGLSSTANSYFNVPTNGYLRWRPPADATYFIQCAGAGVSNAEGVMIGQRLFLKSDQYFWIVPGSQGSDTNQGNGGSFFAHDPSGSNSYANAAPLVIAGGGGSTYNNIGGWCRAQTYQNPCVPWPPDGSNGVVSATTGRGGYGYHGGPGGGFYGAGNWGSGGQQGNRAGGGFTVNSWGGPLVGGTDQGDGGFGGGAGYHTGANAGGGGGGYTGGAGGNGWGRGGGQGGGSYLTTSFNGVNGSDYRTNTGNFDGSSSFNGVSISTSGQSYVNGRGYITITRIN